MNINVENQNFENVLIYVSDALREDAVPDPISRNYEVCRTVANGLATPECFASILTGRYPPQHAVWQFGHKLDGGIPTLFDILPNNFFSVGSGLALKQTLNVTQVPDFKIDNLEQPFFSLIRDTSAHIPYGVSLDSQDPDFYSSEEYWNHRKNNKQQIREDYDEGAKKSVDRFLSIIKDLRGKNILENTFVIFTGDHGELLGEYGLVAHGSPTCKELVYVPTVFYNESVSVNGDYLSHVDFLPTIADLIGNEIDGLESLPGYDLVKGTPSERLIFNQVRRLHFHESSVWDGTGGYIFKEDSLIDRIRWFTRHMRGRVTAPYNRRNPVKVLKTFLQGDRHSGKPKFPREDGKRFYEDIISNTQQTNEQDLDQEVINRLEELGYKEEI